MVWIFRCIALGFLAGAVYHTVGLVRPEWTEPAPPSRHALFVPVNLLAAAGFLARPRWFIPIYAALVLQQLYSHGTIGWRVWRDEARIDWPSVIVVVCMPPILALLVWEARRRPSPPGRIRTA